MQPRQLVQTWVDALNRADADALAAFYADNAVNHQVAESPVHGRAAIREMFAVGFASTKMVLGSSRLGVLSRCRRAGRVSTRLLGQTVLSSRAQAAFAGPTVRPKSLRSLAAAQATFAMQTVVGLPSRA
jgi:hypothetical protein